VGVEPRYFDLTVQPLKNRRNAVYGLMSHAVDVTDQVRTKQELAELALALERSNRELDSFAYAASHDLRAPLRGIANLAQWIEEDLLASGPLRGETQDMLELMRLRMHRMEGLIEGLLQYSRAGRTHQAPENIDVRRLVQEVVDLLSPPPGTSLTIARDLPTIRTERSPLQQVFMNLIGNAIKHANRDDPVIVVDARRVGPFYEFSVNDNGPGIPPDYHDRIWGIFQTLESRDRVEGAGIGLALVKKIVESQKGRAWVESAAGSGATFRFLWRKL
jgi:light-regulated signal transduction histidine kinase (bacteriophytochrome)